MEARSTFHVVIRKVFDGWTALQLAVQHGFGGPESARKAEWMVTAVEDWFKENANIEVYELEDFLAVVLENEFETIAEDGSLYEVSKEICECYSLIARGNEEELSRRVCQMRAASLSQSVLSAETANGDTDQGDSQEMETIDAGSCDSMEQTSSREVRDERGDVDMEDEEGWSVVRKGRRR